MLSQMVSPLRSLSNTDNEWQFMSKNYINFESYTPLISMLNQYGIAYNAQDFMKSIEDLSKEVQKMQAIQSQDADVDASILDNVEFISPEESKLLKIFILLFSNTS